MKNRIIFLIALTAASFLPLLAQFEGEIDMKMTGSYGDAQKERLLTLLIKNDMMSISWKGELGADKNSRVIFREDKKMMWIVNDDKKTVMEIPTKDIEELGTKTSKDVHPEAVKFHKSGKSQTILGYQCDGWIVEKENETKEVYGTTKLGSIYDGFLKSLKRMSGGRMESMMNEFEAEMMRQKFFPMKSTTTRDGSVASTEEVTKIEPRSLAVSTFEAPSGYKKQSLGAEMEGAMKKMQEEMKKYKQSGKMTPEMQKMIEEQMKKMQEKHKPDDDSSK